MNSSEIAKIAGVSRSTVSRVINNYDNVPDETRKKVMEIVKKYSYVPHASAQILAGKKNKTIGLFIIDAKGEGCYNKMATNSYFSPFIGAVVQNANKEHYNVLISVINNEKEFKKAEEIFANKTISSGIFIGGMNNEPAIAKIIENGYSTAVIEQESNDIFSSSIIVNGDSFDGAYKAVKYLVKLGHTSIAHICGNMDQYSGILRLEGYKKALSDSKINYRSSLVVKGDYTEESGYKAAMKLFSKEKPTAIFVANDTMVIGVMKALSELNLKIPDDVSVIGFDDIEVAKYLQPPLTTIRQSLLQMAYIATNDLIKSNEKDIRFFANYKVPVELIERGSCKSI